MVLSNTLHGTILDHNIQYPVEKSSLQSSAVNMSWWPAPRQGALIEDCVYTVATMLCSNSLLQHSNALHWIALHSSALQCIALHCTALHCTALQFTALHCNAMHCTALQCTALHCTEIYCIVQDSTALHCNLRHCSALFCYENTELLSSTSPATPEVTRLCCLCSTDNSV